MLVYEVLQCHSSVRTTQSLALPSVEVGLGRLCQVCHGYNCQGKERWHGNKQKQTKTEKGRKKKNLYENNNEVDLEVKVNVFVCWRKLFKQKEHAK